MTTIYIDADACPVKSEVYRVAQRLGLKVMLVADAWLRTPDDSNIQMVVVDSGPDAADDWIADHVTAVDIVITQDVPLAARVVHAGAEALSAQGRVFDSVTIGAALATRDLMTDLRSAGLETRGPQAFSARDRSSFLQALDAAAIRARRRAMSVG